MASALTVLPLVAVEEYLNSSYEHDVDFVDGILEERGMPTLAHSLLQGLLYAWFLQCSKNYRFKALLELRTQIVKGARYRIPDLLLCPLPLPAGRICDVVPLAVFEILSPDDTLARTRVRFRDYAAIGVPHLILLDPEECVAFRYDNGSLIQTAFESLELPGNAGPLPFPSEQLFAQLRAERAEE
jgi:Uma2 family endonuclease